MRTAAWETAPQAALGNCSSAAVGKVMTYDVGEGAVQCNRVLILQKVCCQSRGADVTAKGFSASLDMRRCKDWDHEISS